MRKKNTNYLAVVSSIFSRTVATIGAQAIHAGSSVFTRLRVTFILLELTKDPMKTRTATARKGVDVVDTSPIIKAGAIETNKYFNLK